MAFNPQNLLTKKGLVQLISQPDGNTVIAFDATLKEKHSRASPPTEFEVENGVTISDHITVKPFKLQLEVFMTDTPLSVLTGLATSAAAVAAGAVNQKIAAANSGAGKVIAASKTAAILAPAFDFTKRRAASIWSQLLNMQDARLPMNVLTSIFLYRNMFIENLSTPRDNKTGRGLVFDLDLVQLRIVSPQTVNIVKFSTPDLSAGLADKGKTAADQPGAAAAQKGFTAGHTLAAPGGIH